MPKGVKNLPVNFTYLRFLIKKKKLVVGEVAEELGISIHQFSDMLNGRKTFSAARLKKVAEMLGVSHEIFYDSVGALLYRKLEADIVDFSMTPGRGDVKELDDYVALGERLGLIHPQSPEDEIPGDAENQDADLLAEGDLPDAYDKGGEKS